MATHSSQTSRTYQARDKGRGLERIALSTLATDASLDLVVFGHSHVATLVRAPSGGVYANAGSWLDAPTYLRVEPHEIALLRWDGLAEGHRLDALERRTEESLRHP